MERDKNVSNMLLTGLVFASFCVAIYSKPTTCKLNYNSQRNPKLSRNLYGIGKLNYDGSVISNISESEEWSIIESEQKESSIPKCGLRNFHGVIDFRITGGVHNTAQYGEFPWMIMVLVESTLKGQTVSKYKCGGSLLHPKVVLTAAHCVISENVALLQVRGGEWNTQTNDEIIQHQDRKVQEVIIHEDFSSGTGANDLALLILTNAFANRKTLGIICLPQQDDVIISKYCFASGWGTDLEGKSQRTLKKVQLPIIPRNTCEESFQEYYNSSDFYLHSSFICAGGNEGFDTCSGDGGGPLVCPIQGNKVQYQQAGIVSWGIGCGSTLPGIYISVSKFRSWIDQIFSARGIEPWYHY